MSYKVGVVIGRFQIDSLHAAHSRLLDHALSSNDRLMIFIGVPAIQGTLINPLDYQTREAMVREHIRNNPRVTIMPLHDREFDEDWSAQIDRNLAIVFPDAAKVTLYHARDGFGDHYHGKHECVDLDTTYESIECSGTATRERIGARTVATQDFRQGVIYASQHVWPFVKMACDMICYKPPTDVSGSHGMKLDGSVLVGRKEGEVKWRLPGGHVDPDDTSMEHAAIRELMEETSILVEATPEYVCSGPVADWRYGKLPNEALFTICFSAPYCYGAERAADDLAEVKWMAFDDAAEALRDEHRKMFLIFLEKNYPGHKALLPLL